MRLPCEISSKFASNSILSTNRRVGVTQLANLKTTWKMI